jgi:hypothetical protein
MMNFFFTAQWYQALAGLNGISSALQSIAYAILAATFLMGVYEGFLAGGSLQKFGMSILKFGIAGAVIANWSTFFNDVVATGTSIATVILGGSGDLMKQWSTDLGAQMTPSNLASLASNGMSAFAMSIVFLAVVVVSAVLFFGCLKLFTLLFIFWGGILFCMGPLMIALSPSGLVGSYAGQYCKSLAEWALWPAMYAMFATLMVALNMASVSAIMAQNASTIPGSVDLASSNALQLAVTSLLYGVCLVLVPFLAHFIIKGDFAGVANGAIRMAKMAAGLASGGAASVGLAATSTAGGGGMAPYPMTTGGGGGSMSMPPPPSASGGLPPPSTLGEASSQMLSSSTTSGGSNMSSSSSTGGGSPASGGTLSSSSTNSGSVGSSPRLGDGSSASSTTGGSGSSGSATHGGGGSSTAAIGSGFQSSSSTTADRRFSSSSSTNGGMSSVPPPLPDSRNDSGSGDTPPTSD